MSQTPATIPADDLARALILAQPDANQDLPHIGIVGDTYTILLSGKDTAGRLCLIDMHIPPNGGPPPHRHDFEETFILLAGELEATFRGRSPPSTPAKASTFPPTHRTSSTTAPPSPSACSASAPPPARKTSSARSASPSPPAPPPRRHSMKPPSMPSWPKPRPSPPNTRPNSSSTPDPYSNGVISTKASHRNAAVGRPAVRRHKPVLSIEAGQPHCPTWRRDPQPPTRPHSARPAYAVSSRLKALHPQRRSGGTCGSHLESLAVPSRAHSI